MPRMDRPCCNAAWGGRRALRAFAAPGRPGAVQVLAAALAASMAVCLSGGCVTQNRGSLVHPCQHRRFQECSVKLAAYKPVQERPGQDASLAVAVAISGGGHRAGNFGAGVLWGLEEIERAKGAKGTDSSRLPNGAGAGRAANAPTEGADGPGAPTNALREVDYLSTVSGGGLAAAAYVSSLHDHLRFGGTHADYSFIRAFGPPEAHPPDIGRQRTDPLLRTHLEYNYVNDLIRGIFYLTTSSVLDRGDYLELSFDDHVMGYLWRRRKLDSVGDKRDPSLTLGDLFAAPDAEGPPGLPYWVANATVYENGAIFAFTPDHLELYEISGYVHRLAKVRHAGPKGDYRDFHRRVPLSLGLTASGTFPVAIPANTLNSDMDASNPFLHLLDGGVAENIGVVTAVRLLRRDPAAGVRRRVLIVIDAYNGPLNPFSSGEKAPLMIATAFRATTANLDSWRGRYRDLVRDLCRASGDGQEVHPVFLSFDDLEDLKDFQPLFDLGFSPSDLNQLKGTGLLYGAPITPFLLVREVWTWFGLSKAEQNLLIAAGRYIARRRAADIRQALGWEAPQGPTSAPATAT